jgi:hypothetical protein
MTLSQLGRYSRLGLLMLGFAAGLVALGFSCKKKGVVVDSTYLHTIYSFINL